VGEIEIPLKHITKKKIAPPYRALIISLFCCLFVFSVNAYTVAPVISPGASVFIGEEGLNVDSAIVTLDNTSSFSNMSIGWWASPAVVGIIPPTRSISLVGRNTSLTVAPVDFVGFTGDWYLLQPDGITVFGSVFNVVDPSLDISIWDFSHGGVGVNGQPVLRGDSLGVSVVTNMDGAINGAIPRFPINNSTTGYIDIIVRTPSGSTLTGLVDSGGATHSLLQQVVSSQPWIWGGPLQPSPWATGASDGFGNARYPFGTYTIWAESGLNNMIINYRNLGADYTGKTVSPAYSITLTDPTGGSGASDSGDPAPPAAAPPAALPPAVQPVVAQVPGVEPPGNSITPQEVSLSYPTGFQGMTFNANNQNSLDIDLSAARSAGATVTQYFDRVEVYQHHSPGVLFTFWGDKFENSNGRITGVVKRAEFVTDPLYANLSIGNVSGSIHALLPSLTRPALINTTVSDAVDTATINRFRGIVAGSNLVMDSTAFTMDVKKFDVTTGPANVTLTIPSIWVNNNGGKENVRIVRIGEDGREELLSTSFTGIDENGNMRFRGDSPHGTSFFGLLTARATASEQLEHPNTTYVPISKPAMATNAGMFTWLYEIVVENPILIALAAGVAALIIYLGWWRRRL
jgi:hypothetical protein